MSKKEETSTEILSSIRNWIVFGVVLGLMMYAGTNGLGLAIVAGGMYLYQTTVDYIDYDVKGKERMPIMPTMTVSYPIDDCNYSEDEQLCYQMERIADALETPTKESEINKFIDSCLERDGAYNQISEYCKLQDGYAIYFVDWDIESDARIFDWLENPN